MLRLRPYKVFDAQQIIKWSKDEYEFRQWCADKYKCYPITENHINRYYNKMRKDDTFFEMTAFDETGAVGHLTIRFTDKAKKNVRFGFVIVDPSKRGKGYGKELMRLSILYSFSILKAETISLAVFENNLYAYNFYKSVGFNEIVPDKVEQYTIFGEVWKCIEMQMPKNQFIQQTFKAQCLKRNSVTYSKATSNQLR